jgi:hypothetical protein
MKRDPHRLSEKAQEKLILLLWCDSRIVFLDNGKFGVMK